LRAFVIVEPLLQRRPAIGGHAAKALLVAADRRDLCDCGLDSPIGGRQDDRVTAGIAGTPDPDPVGVDVVKVLQERDCSSPVRDLLPGVDVSPWLAAAETKSTVVVDQNDEPRLAEAFRVALQPTVLHPAETVRHGDRRERAGAHWRGEHPGVQPNVVSDGNECFLVAHNRSPV
jgi:hypothetical protein